MSIELDENQSEQQIYVIREQRPQEDAEDPWFVYRKPVMDHPGICKECGYDMCLGKGLRDPDQGWQADQELHDNTVGRPGLSDENPWDYVADHRKKQVLATLQQHMDLVHNRFSKRTMTLDEMAVQYHENDRGKESISLAERRAFEAKQAKKLKGGNK